MKDNSSMGVHIDQALMQSYIIPDSSHCEC